MFSYTKKEIVIAAQDLNVQKHIIENGIFIKEVIIIKIAGGLYTIKSLKKMVLIVLKKVDYFLLN